MACTCGHAEEEHGHDAAHPGSTACTECDCIAWEWDGDDGYDDRAAHPGEKKE
jgi:hypothetical protein